MCIRDRNKTENIQALKNDLRKTKELLQSEKEKTHTVQAMIEECRDKPVSYTHLDVYKRQAEVYPHFLSLLFL